jgi:putative holliday junction resolvase
MGRTLGVDLGDARVGLAISDEGRKLARGLPTIKGGERRTLLRELGTWIGQMEVDEIVVGLPLNMDGTSGTQARKALRFVEQLRREFGLPVKTWDERLTTIAAKQALIDSGTRRSGRSREAIDRVSAILILQAYLDSLSFRDQRDQEIRGDAG